MQYISGVYQILCKLNNKVYIGSSANISKRWRYHLQDLKNNRHKNTHLQHAWNAYGEINFTFSIVEVVDNLSDLVQREQFWLDKTECYNHDNGFNMCRVAESQLGHKWTSEQKKRQSERMKGNVVSADTRLKIGMASRGDNNPNNKLSELDVLEIVKLNNQGVGQHELSLKFGVERTTICAVLNRQNWRHVTDGLEILHISVSGVRGEKHPKAKLSTTDVLEILDALQKKVKIVDLAKKYGVNVGTISRVKNKKGWKSIER